MEIDLPHLKAKVEEATAGLPGVEPKRLFGCDGFFTGGTIFAMIWKEGRIGLKLPDAKVEADLRAMDGASSWCPGGKMTISSWVFVPPRFHDDKRALATWVAKAHALARANPRKAAMPKAAARPKSAAKLKKAK